MTQMEQWHAGHQALASTLLAAHTRPSEGLWPRPVAPTGRPEYDSSIVPRQIHKSQCADHPLRLTKEPETTASGPDDSATHPQYSSSFFGAEETM